MALILVVDDEININQVLSEVLTLEGFEVINAFDGDEAIEKARCHKPAAILLDIGLPKKTGWEVLPILKADEATKAIPVVILSAWSQKEDIERGLGLGAHKYLTKPFNPLDVITALQEIVNGKKG